MSEWQEVKLGELVDIGSSKRVFYEDYVNSGIPFYRSKEVIEKHHGNDISTDLFITKEKFEQIKAKYGAPEAGDLLLTSVGTLGIPYIVEEGEEFYFKDGNLTWFKNYNTKLYNKFLYYWIMSPIGKNALDMISIGSTQAALTIQGLKNLYFYAPPIEEQKAIASVLTSLDDKIDLLHRQNTTLESMAKTLFRQWFVEEAQEGWSTTSLDKHAEAFRGLSYKGSGLCGAGEGLPMHNLNSVYEGGGYKSLGIKFYSGEYKPRHLLKPGDLIVANTEQGHEFRLIGYPAIVPKNFGAQGLFSQHIYRLTLNPNTYLTTEFLYFLLMTPFVREQIIAATNGSTVNMLSIDGLQRPEFKLPPKEKVIEFTDIVKSVWLKKENNTEQIRSLEKLRDNLLPKLMSGEVRVKV